MKKFVIAFICTSLFCTSTMRADIPADLPEEKYVGQASEDSTRAANKERWTNIALAVGAVAVATTALILVANNKGKSNP